MQVSERWLREWADPAVSTQQLADTLTMAGLEVDSTEPAAPVFSGVVAVKVVSLAEHPEATKLQVCGVDDGSGQPKTVVCGAANVRAGMTGALARVGAKLPGDVLVEIRTLGGIDSAGMLCSGAELGLAESSAGILELPGTCEPGTDVYEGLGLDDTVISIDLTPNRADCLSIQGLAREVSALFGVPLTNQAPGIREAHSLETIFPVSVEAPEDCPRYVGRVIKGVAGNAQAPFWIQEKLRRCGIRSVNAITDITNFVMLELGQPMHAFDLDSLQSGIRVRFARPLETLLLLNGQEVKLAEDELVIADDQRPVALAGIMGGQQTAVEGHTRSVFLECAWFRPETIAGRARRYGLHTDSSHRFERGVDPDLAHRAMQRATQLILETVGGDAGPILCEENPSFLPQPARIELESPGVEALLGVSVETSEIRSLLERLYCSVSHTGQILHVIPPGFRTDLSIAEDLIEEIARLKGYENIPASRMDTVHVTSAGDAPSSASPLDQMKQALVLRGYNEIISFSFINPRVERLFNPDHEAKELENPISRDLSVMRSSIWPGLVQTARYNFNRQQMRARMFEQGLQFRQTPQGLMQLPVLSGLITGDCEPLQWGIRSRKSDFYDIKGDVEHLLEIAAVPRNELHFEALEDPGLHPGQAARGVFAGHTLVRLGALHPRIQAELDIDQGVFLFELQLSVLPQETPDRNFRPLSRFPSIRRDLTLVVNEALQAAEIRSNIEQMQIACLQHAEIFSVYTGKGIPEGKKSVSLGLILQEFSRTLTDKEIEQIVTQIVSRLESKLGAEIRT